MLRRYLLTTALLFLSLLPVKARITESDKRVPVSGFVIERLSATDAEKWKAIEQIVFAEDGQQQSLHPTLRNLWQWIETSGHTVFIEIIRIRGVASCTAGLFHIERFDPLGNHHVAVIKLNLDSINQALVSSDSARANGFIPFQGLEKEERYAEVLGHELAHAVHILTNLERVRLVEEAIQQTNQTLLAFIKRRKSGDLAAELKRRLHKRDVLLQSLEAQAEEMERVIWRELAAQSLAVSRQAGRK
ncbi:MAG: hypothetical protein ACKVZH_22105 [Blastocatellia bacterium]